MHWQRTATFHKSQTTADYQPTTVKSHLLKKTTGMNIKLNIGKNKRDSEKRENKGMSRRENVTGDIQTQKIYSCSHFTDS